MVRGDIHSPHLRALLDFESQRMGLPLSYHEAVLADDYQPPAFRREALIIAHTGFAPDPFGLPVEGGEVLVCVPAHIPKLPDNAVVVLGPDGRTPLGAVIRNVLLVFFSLEALSEPSAVVKRRPEGSAGNILAAVFEMIMVRAVPILVANVRDYDWKAEQEQFAATRVRQVQARVARLEEDARNNDYAIESKTQEIAQLAHKNRELREHARLLESVTTREMKERAALELLALMKMAPRGCSAMDVQDEAIVVETHPVWVEHDDHDFDLGTFRVAIRLADDQVVIHKVTGSSPSGYPHPHVSSTGVPCYGNIGAPLVKLLAEGQYAAAVSVLLQFLQSYNGGDAYIRIEHWDSEWREERWERCYDNASSEDCIDCEDSDCPYYGDRHDRCWSRHQGDIDDLRECVRCRECSYHENAQDRCRELSATRDCIDCDISNCGYANDEDDMRSCRDDDGDCEDCSAGPCIFQGQPHDDNDDEGEEAA